MKILPWLWAFVPDSAKLWVALGLATLALSGVAVIVYKIDSAGFNRCEAAHTAAQAKQKEEARKNIIKSGKKYDEIKGDIIHQTTPNDPVGPRIGLALDRLPPASER